MAADAAACSLVAAGAMLVHADFVCGLKQAHSWSGLQCSVLTLLKTLF